MPGHNELLDLVIKRVEDYAVYLLDPDGHVLTWNPGAERIKGYAEREILGRHLSVFFPPEDRHKAASALRAAAEVGHFEGEAWRIRKDGTRFWGAVSLTALKNESGELKGYVKITRDLTERKRAEERLQATELKYELLMAGVKEYAVFMLDPAGRVIDWSPAAEKLLGYSEREILGRPLETFFPPDQHGSGGTPSTVLRAAAKQGRTEEESWHVRKDGSRFWGSGITSALRDEHGGLRGYAKVLLDRTDRKRADEAKAAEAMALARVNEALATANEALKEADRRKDEFLAMLAHELRNPLAPVRVGLDLLSLQGADAEVVEPMREQVRNLGRIVDDLLDVARLLRGRSELRLESTELVSALDLAVGSVRPSADNRRQIVSVSLPNAAIRLYADPVRLVQILTNLLDNASKYSGEGSEIRISATAENGYVAIQVADDGVGIDPQLLPRVFDLFAQGIQPLARTQGGLGIGLSVVKSLVEQHGGSVSARSSGPGRGSEFTVRLPVAAEPAGEPVASAGTVDDALMVSPSRRILVVEDNVALAKMITSLLRQLGAKNVSEAYDGQAAVEAAALDRPDLVLLDIGLPKLDGFEVAKQLRQLPEFEDVLVVALTGYGSAEDRLRSAEAGIDEHFVKPAGVETLRAVLSHPKLKRN